MDSRLWLELICKGWALSRILDRLPPEVPDIRELRIQNEKLIRMLADPPWKDKMLTSDLSIKKYKKEQGKFALKVGEQAKKVRAMTDKSFKLWFRQSKPFSNAQFREWRQKFDAAIAQSADKMQRQVTDNVLKQMGAQEPPKLSYAMALLGRGTKN